MTLCCVVLYCVFAFGREEVWLSFLGYGELAYKVLCVAPEGETSLRMTVTLFQGSSDLGQLQDGELLLGDLLHLVMYAALRKTGACLGVLANRILVYWGLH